MKEITNKQIQKALFWLTDEVANLQSHLGAEAGESEGMSRDEFFSANRDYMREKLSNILGYGSGRNI